MKFVGISIAAAIFCVSNISYATEASSDDGWTKLSGNVQQKLNLDGSVSTRFFGEEAMSASRIILQKSVDDLSAKVAQGSAGVDDLSTLNWAQEYLQTDQVPAASTASASPKGGVQKTISPNSVVRSGDTCEVVYSIDHKDGPYGVGGASLRVIAESTAHWDMWGPSKPISTITHFDSGTIVPAGPYAGEAPVTQSTLLDVPAQNSTYVSSTTNWYKPVFGDQTNFCTASASTIITVNYSNGTHCQIAQTTSFPDCTRHP